MYVKEARLFLGLGLLLIPTVFVITAIQWLIVTGLDALGSVTGDLAGIFAYLALVDRSDADAARARARDGGDGVRARRAGRGTPGRPDEGVPPRLPSDPAAPGRDRALRRDVGRAHDDRLPDPRGPLARGSVGATRSRRRARGPDGARGAPPERASSSVVAGSASARSSCSAASSRSLPGRCSARC